MRLVRLRQAAAATGVLAFISGLVAVSALSGNQPGATDSVASVESYISGHLPGIYMHHTFLSLEFVLALGFAIFLCSVLRQAEGDPGTFSALAMAGAIAAVTAELVVLAVHSATFVPAANTVDLRSLATAVVKELTILELFPWAAFFAGVAVVSLARGALPGWLGWISAALAVLDLLVGVWSGLTGVNAMLDINSFIPPFVLVYVVPELWLVAASVVLLRRELMSPASARRTQAPKGAF